MRLLSRLFRVLKRLLNDFPFERENVMGILDKLSGPMFRRFLTESTVKPQKTGNTDRGHFCLVRWPDRTSFDIVSERDIQAPPNSILNYETYVVDYNGKQRKGVVLLKGSRDDCEEFHAKMAASVPARPPPPRSAKTPKPSTTARRNPTATASGILCDIKEESGGNKTDDDSIQKQVLMGFLQMILANQTTKAAENEEAHNVKCDGCRSSPIRSDRYKCLICDDIDLCGHCFERRSEPGEHKSGHVFAHFKSPGELFGKAVKNEDLTLARLKRAYAEDVHESISCDGCGTDSIQGLRFKCDACPNYDLCQRCVERGATTKKHASSHPLIVIQVRAMRQIPVEDIDLGEKLGEGAFGAVFKARWISKKRVVACKVVQVPATKEAERLERSFLKELGAYSELSGAYILKTFGFAAARQGPNKIYMLIMEFMSRGSLSSVIKKEGTKLSLRRKLDIARNVASGMRKIHEHHMIHRDIRSDNILVNENYLAKIGDMGIARPIDPMNQHTQIGCQRFMPPEFYKGSYDQKLDIFTFGLTLNELFTSTEHSFQPFVSDKIAFAEQSPVFDELIGRCTRHDPKQRPTAIEIEKTLELYGTAFNEMVVKKHPEYTDLPTDDKDEIFVAFYKQFHAPATEFIRKQFPRELIDGADDGGGVKVDKSAGEGIRIECPVQ